MVVRHSCFVTRAAKTAGRPVKTVVRHSGFATRDAKTLHLGQLFCISDSKICMSNTQFPRFGALDGCGLSGAQKAELAFYDQCLSGRFLGVHPSNRDSRNLGAFETTTPRSCRSQGAARCNGRHCVEIRQVAHNAGPPPLSCPALRMT